MVIWQNQHPDRLTSSNRSSPIPIKNMLTSMNALLLARFFPNRSLVIHNLTVIQIEELHQASENWPARTNWVMLSLNALGSPESFMREAVNGLAHEYAWD